MQNKKRGKSAKSTKSALIQRGSNSQKLSGGIRQTKNRQKVEEIKKQKINETQEAIKHGTMAIWQRRGEQGRVYIHLGMKHR